MDDVISKQAAIDEMQKIRRQQQMLDDTHKADLVMQGIYLAEKALDKLPSAGNEEELDKLRDQLNNRLDYISELEAKCRELTEKLHETELAVEHNRHVAEEEQLRGGTEIP